MQVRVAPHKPIRSTIVLSALALIALTLIIVQPTRQGINGWTVILMLTMVVCVLRIAIMWGDWDRSNQQALNNAIKPHWDAPEVHDGDTVLSWHSIEG